MPARTHEAAVGVLLRDWRLRRRRSQLDLFLEAGISARHLSFVETGRSRPSPDMVERLAEYLEVPLRERNTLLLAAGFAPQHPERSLDDASMGPVRETLDLVLRIPDEDGRVAAAPADSGIAVPLWIRSRAQELCFLSTITTFGTAIEITASELSIESFFPADPATTAFLRALPHR